VAGAAWEQLGGREAATHPGACPRSPGPGVQTSSPVTHERVDTAVLPCAFLLSVQVCNRKLEKKREKKKATEEQQS